MAKRLVKIGDELLQAAQRELPTIGVSDTVRAALRQAAAISARAPQVQGLTEEGLAKLAGADARAAVWR